MQGTAYAIAEIVVFLAIATLIGMGIGWALARLRSTDGTAAAALAEETDRARELEQQVKRLETETERLAAAAPDVEGLRKELAQAQWQIRALEDALAEQTPS